MLICLIACFTRFVSFFDVFIFSNVDLCDRMDPPHFFLWCWYVLICCYVLLNMVFLISCFHTCVYIAIVRIFFSLWIFPMHEFFFIIIIMVYDVLLPYYATHLYFSDDLLNNMLPQYFVWLGFKFFLCLGFFLSQAIAMHGLSSLVFYWYSEIDLYFS